MRPRPHEIVAAATTLAGGSAAAAHEVSLNGQQPPTGPKTEPRPERTPGQRRAVLDVEKRWTALMRLARTTATASAICRELHFSQDTLARIANEADIDLQKRAKMLCSLKPGAPLPGTEPEPLATETDLLEGWAEGGTCRWCTHVYASMPRDELIEAARFHRANTCALPLRLSG
jgi:hypothetical protein